jgi:hypothetical protein
VKVVKWAFSVWKPYTCWAIASCLEPSPVWTVEGSRGI